MALMRLVDVDQPTYVHSCLGRIFQGQQHGRTSLEPGYHYRLYTTNVMEAIKNNPCHPSILTNPPDELLWPRPGVG